MASAGKASSAALYAASSGFSDALFEHFSAYIQRELGIKMPLAKKTMLHARLQKRLRQLKLSSFDDYYDYVFGDQGRKEELHHMIDAVTTNKTDFFREPRHFEFLSSTVLPQLCRKADRGGLGRFRVWSAGCSTGEEPYTLSMVLSEFKARYAGFGFTILATDISTQVLHKAAAGIYTEADVAPVPLAYRKKYLLRSKDRKRGLVRIVPHLRRLVSFGRLNFMDEAYGIKEAMHVIFCRNVIIYFDKPTQEKMLNRLCRHLQPGGYLFMGHSETLNGLNVPLKLVTSTVYQKVW
jgi:chemotaxis protein methyltransferase CheR